MRIRIRFTKTGKIRWTSHRDIARVWERTIRIAGLPVAYSLGFSPHPKLHFGLALSTGHESLAEFLDIDLDPEAPNAPSEADLAGLPERLTAALPVGLEVTSVGTIASNATSLQQAVTSCEWRIEIRGAEPAVVADAIDRVLAANELTVTRQRKGKDVTDDVRPYLLALAVVGPTEHGTEIDAHLATQPRGLRTSELLAVLDTGGEEGRVRRLNQWMLLDGAQVEPLAGPHGATSAPRAEVRAS
ncbi:TIGR03936 family radical SAM-associated protein [Aquihabitans sp. G128]|uniref:TIGR03936 family radical SAM-associated protein n=1 Tax=Aquihabitans sp. G128 TaxID=2849779 RepID=UPI001C21D890|nr:TIGR03936 family radical SAM-associated protein [Aquihabitans sp. G128]QXC62721.1 TIGR03936 family radical SAM-associated protein [Aquihabitans sp. G128]